MDTESTITDVKRLKELRGLLVAWCNLSMNHNGTCDYAVDYQGSPNAGCTCGHEAEWLALRSLTELVLEGEEEREYR